MEREREREREKEKERERERGRDSSLSIFFLYTFFLSPKNRTEYPKWQLINLNLYTKLLIPFNNIWHYEVYTLYMIVHLIVAIDVVNSLY